MSKLTKTTGPLTGVCGGIGKSMGIDPNIIRVGFVLVSWFMGIGLIIYIVLAVALPKDLSNPFEQSNSANNFTSTPPGKPNVPNENVIFCRNCGSKNDAKGKFCRKCGGEL